MDNQNTVILDNKNTTVMEKKEQRKTVTRVFVELRKKKNGSFICKQNWTCCQSCGWAEIPDGENIVFYHQQDKDCFYDSGKLFLCWSGDGNKIAETFRNEGVKVDWNGEENIRIRLDFNKPNPDQL